MARNNNLNENRDYIIETEITRCRHDAVIYIDDGRLVEENYAFIPGYMSEAGCMNCGRIILASATDYTIYGNIFRRISQHEKEASCWGV